MENDIDNRPSYIPRIYNSNGINQNEWIKLLYQIRSGDLEKYKDIILDLKKSLIDKNNIELTIDLIDLIIDYGEEQIIKQIANEEFLSNFIDLLREKNNLPIYIQKKIVYLVKKWAFKSDEYPIFKEKYELLKSKKIIFPSNNFNIQTYNKYISNDELFKRKLEIDQIILSRKNTNALIKNFSENVKTKIIPKNEDAPATPQYNIDNNIKDSLFRTPNNNNINNDNINIINIDNNSTVLSKHLEMHEKECRKYMKNGDEIENMNIFNVKNDIINPENFGENININNSKINDNKNIKTSSIIQNEPKEKNFDINSYKKELGDKLLNINKKIDYGKGTCFNNELFKEVIGLMNEISHCEKMMNKYSNNTYILENLSKLKMDIKQTCFRYENFLYNNKIFPFVSSFFNNSNQYNFNENAILNYNVNNYNKIEN